MIDNAVITIFSVLLLLMVGLVAWVTVANLNELDFGETLSVPALAPNEASVVPVPEVIDQGQPVQRIQDFPVVRPGG